MDAPTDTIFRAMVGPLVEAGQWLFSLLPTGFSFRKPHFNFITVHYMYIIGCAIVGSIILYGNGFMTYTNAIFFAAGGSTQSGLNPININDLYLYQQIVLMLIPCISNPIIINTTVVFVRLYWFEKRFAHIVKESRALRKSKSRLSRSKSQMAENSEPAMLEKGVRGKKIQVLHETTHPNGMSVTAASRPIPEQKEFAEIMGLKNPGESDEPTSSSDSSGIAAAATEPVNANAEPRHDNDASHDSGDHPPFHRDIMFADEVPTAENESRTQEKDDHDDMSKHIKFLEKQQREAHDGPAIRIPGPRDFDRGEVPQPLDSSDDDEVHRVSTANTGSTIRKSKAQRISNDGRSAELNRDDHPERSGITFQEQQHPGHRDWAHETAHDRPGTSASRSGHRLGHEGIVRSRSRLSLNDARESIGRTLSTFTTARSRDKSDGLLPYLSYQATIGRNSAFLSLTAEQREELGGIEYRSLKCLAKVLILYYVGFHVLGMMILTPWIIHTSRWRNVVVSDGVDPGWWGVFTAASAFTDTGFTLTPDSMESFSGSVLVMLLGSFLIVIGNTGFPVMLRFVIWFASKIAPTGSATWEELRFLLDHPRRCFTLLFPSKATWWLFWILVLLNGIDLIFYIILDINVSVVDNTAAGYRVLDGLFQATATRTAGFSCVNVSKLHPAIQVSYMVMMYISVFPIAISVRRTNVYEEKSLGIWGGEEVTEGADTSFVPQHLRRQLSFDLWYIFLGFFIICIVEGSAIENPERPGLNFFAVLFEIVSAYGTVGLSLGYPHTDTSLSAQFKVLSKLVIIAMMIRGRHRGLPYALDRAILLPSEDLHKKEQEDAERRYGRRGSMFAETYASTLPRRATWNELELDENGLPKQHFGLSRSASTAVDGAPAAEGATDEHGPVMSQPMTRRSSGLSNSSPTRTRHQRSLSRVLAGGLSAGPTLPKRD